MKKKVSCKIRGRKHMPLLENGQHWRDFTSVYIVRDHFIIITLDSILYFISYIDDYIFRTETEHAIALRPELIRYLWSNKGQRGVDNTTHYTTAPCLFLIIFPMYIRVVNFRYWCERSTFPPEQQTWWLPAYTESHASNRKGKNVTIHNSVLHMNTSEKWKEHGLLKEGAKEMKGMRRNKEGGRKWLLVYRHVYSSLWLTCTI